MQLDERIGWLLLGMAVGLILGNIMSRLDGIRNQLDNFRNQRGEFDWKDAALLAVVVVTVYAAVASQVATNTAQETQKNNIRSLCIAGANSRQVQRATVDAIYKLATGSLPTPKHLSDARLQMYNDYIDRVNKFRRSMYNKIQPPASCAPYVDDFNVEPPTPPIQHIKQ